jgi:lipopolysaccharide cholinephosphotransferase
MVSLQQHAVTVTWSPGKSYPCVPQATVDQVYRGLRTVDALFGALEIPYIARGGTLLGAVRHGGLIPWDADGDVGVRREDVPRLLAEHHLVLTDRGFGLARERRFGLLKIFPLDGVKIRPWHQFRFPYIDIFPMVEGPIGWTYAAWLSRHRWPTENFDRSAFTGLQRYRFGPLHLSGPVTATAERYLDSAYGPTWRSEARFETHHVAGLRDLAPQPMATFPAATPSDAVVSEWGTSP